MNSVFSVAQRTQNDVTPFTVQKPASVLVWVCISAHGVGNLHIVKASLLLNDASFRATYAAIQTMSKHIVLKEKPQKRYFQHCNTQWCEITFLESQETNPPPSSV